MTVVKGTLAAPAGQHCHQEQQSLPTSPGPLALWATLALPHPSKTSFILPLPPLSHFSSCHQAKQEEESILPQWRRGERKSDLNGGRSHWGEGQLTVQGSGLGSITQEIHTKWSWYGREKGEILHTPSTALHSPVDSHLPLLCLPDQNAFICPSSFVCLTLCWHWPSPLL